MALATTTLGAGPLATDDETQRFAMLVRGVIAKVGTQTKASALLGMSQSYLSRVERGVAVRVRRTLLQVVSLRLNIPWSIWSANPGQSAHEWALEVLETLALVDSSTRTNLERERLVALVRSSIEREGGQVAAAAFLGVSQAHVSRLAQGEAPEAFHRRTLEAIAHALNFPPEAFAADASIPASEWAEHAIAGVSTSRPTEPAPSVYDLVRRMDARELRAFRAWVLAWTDEGPDAA